MSIATYIVVAVVGGNWALAEEGHGESESPASSESLAKALRALSIEYEVNLIALDPSTAIAASKVPEPGKTASLNPKSSKGERIEAALRSLGCRAIRATETTWLVKALRPFDFPQGEDSLRLILSVCGEDGQGVVVCVDEPLHETTTAVQGCGSMEVVRLILAGNTAVRMETVNEILVISDRWGKGKPAAEIKNFIDPEYEREGALAALSGLLANQPAPISTDLPAGVHQLTDVLSEIGKRRQLEFTIDPVLSNKDGYREIWVDPAIDDLQLLMMIALHTGARVEVHDGAVHFQNDGDANINMGGLPADIVFEVFCEELSLQARGVCDPAPLIGLEMQSSVNWRTRLNSVLTAMGATGEVKESTLTVRCK